MTDHPIGGCPDRYLYGPDGTRYRITTVTRLALGPPICGTDCDHHLAPTPTHDQSQDQAPDQGSLWEDTP